MQASPPPSDAASPLPSPKTGAPFRPGILSLLRFFIEAPLRYIVIPMVSRIVGPVLRYIILPLVRLIAGALLRQVTVPLFRPLVEPLQPLIDYTWQIQDSTNYYYVNGMRQANALSDQTRQRFQRSVKLLSALPKISQTVTPTTATA
uniref:Lipid A biosynthesis acyltransferase n=1 Tax=Panagrellus redivivus TaxID=6233 RepID=A0A7E4UQJ4_PANRE